MRAPRLTIRACMVIVALCAFGAAMWRRSAMFAAEAERYRWQQLEDELNAQAATSKNFEVLPPRKVTPDQEAEESDFLRWAEFDQRMQRKYRRAARWPWLPAGPDPVRPGPEPPPGPRL